MDSALAAVARLATRFGLPADDLRIESDRGNLLVHLAPAPVLARVATLTAWTRRDPAAWLAREVTVAAHAAARGGPVVGPAPHPGPHDVDGFVISLWEHREIRPGRPTAFDTGVHLAELHRSLDGVDGLPWLAPATTQVTDALDAIEAAGARPRAEIAALRERHRAVLLDLRGSDPIVLHGDAHPGNLRRDSAGWFWVDLEETCVGPPEWDLAVAAGDGDVAAVLAGYAHAGGRVVDPAALEPFAAARAVEAAAWLAAMAHLRPAAYAEAAAARIAQVLSAPGRRAGARSWPPGPSRGSCS